MLPRKPRHQLAYNRKNYLIFKQLGNWFQVITALQLVSWTFLKWDLRAVSRSKRVSTSRIFAVLIQSGACQYEIRVRGFIRVYRKANIDAIVVNLLGDCCCGCCCITTRISKIVDNYVPKNLILYLQTS